MKSSSTLRSRCCLPPVATSLLTHQLHGPTTHSDQPTGRLALVFELMDKNIYEVIRGRRHYVSENRVKGYMYQLMKSMDHMHRWVKGGSLPCEWCRRAATSV